MKPGICVRSVAFWLAGNFPHEYAMTSAFHATPFECSEARREHGLLGASCNILPLVGTCFKGMGVFEAFSGSRFFCAASAAFPVVYGHGGVKDCAGVFLQRDMRLPPKLLRRGFPAFTNAELGSGAGSHGRRSPGEIWAFSIVKLAQASDKILVAFFNARKPLWGRFCRNFACYALAVCFGKCAPCGWMVCFACVGFEAEVCVLGGGKCAH